MKNNPVLDGKIIDDKVFFENLLEDWQNAEELYKNWDKISEEFRKNKDHILDVDLPSNILDALKFTKWWNPMLFTERGNKNA